jgi:hypothetical protein
MSRRLSRPASGWAWLGFGLSLVALHVILGAAPSPAALVPTLMRVPLELAVLLLIVTFAPEAWRRPIRWTVLAFLAALTLLKLFDLGFFLAFDRPFDAALDLYLLPDGWTLLKGSVGVWKAAVAVGGIVVAFAAVVTGLYWSLRGLEALRAPSPRRLAAGGLAAGLAVLALIPLGDQVGLPGAPAASLISEHIKISAANLKGIGAFRQKLAADPYAQVPNDRLLQALKGKDVVLIFVESYGRGALEEPRYAGVIQPRLSAIESGIAKSGFQARSAWMGSPTHGGQSWLAHESLLSGLWIDGSSRYDLLTRSTRSTLIRDFGRAGWRTVAIMPAISEAWPEGKFLGYQKVYGAHDLGYRGPPFNWVTMPDQFTLLAMKRAEFDKPNRPPVMAEMTLLTSHAPFTPIPKVVDWDAIGDGSKVYPPMVADAESPASLWRDMDRVAKAYVATIDYSLESIGNYVRDFGDDRLVVIALGDHQPGGALTAAGGPHETPVHLFAKDPKVLAAVDGWGWRAGMRPDPKSKAMPMDEFRGRLIEAFTPAGP